MLRMHIIIRFLERKRERERERERERDEVHILLKMYMAEFRDFFMVENFKV
jgi:hypothetical protein